MGHYDGVEEAIAARREENDRIIKPLSSEEFAAAWIQKEIDWQKMEWQRVVRYLSDLESRLNKLNITPNPEAVKVLSFNGSDYEYKLRHDKVVRKILRDE